MGALTPAQALLASGVIGASGSLGGGLLSASSAARNNQTALDFNKWSQLQAQQFQRQMYTQQRNDQEDFYKKYQSPQAIASALSQLGVNPAVPLSGGHGIGASPASMPSGISSPALSAPVLQNEGESMSKSIEAIGSALASIAQASSSNEQSDEMAQTFITRVNRMMLDNVGQKLSNDNAQFNLLAAQARLPYEITQLVSQAFLDFSQGELNKSLKKINDVTAYVKEHTKDIDIQYQNELLRLLGVQINDVNEAVNLKKEEQKTERSKQNLNYASAKNQSAQAALSSSQKSFQVMVNKIKSDTSDKEIEHMLSNWSAQNKLNDATKERAKTMINRWRKLNDNDKNAAADYLNYMLWFIASENTPDIPVVPFMKLGK